MLSSIGLINLWEINLLKKPEIMLIVAKQRIFYNYKQSLLHM